MPSFTSYELLALVFNLSLSGRLRKLMAPVQVVVSVAILYLLFRNVNLAETWQILSQVDVPVLLLSVVFFLLFSFAIGF